MNEHQPPGARILALVDRVRESPDDDVAALLAEECRGRSWLGGIAPATESTISTLRQFMARDPNGSASPIQVAQSTIEPPSAQLAFRSVYPNAEFHPQSVDKPDPRRPLYPGRGVAVWRYTGRLPRPAVGPPSAAVAARVRALAVPIWPHIPAVHQQAAELADVSIEDLLGVLVHPPTPREEPGRRCPPDVWIRSVQVMACLGIAWHRVDQPWRGSDRARVLTELCQGPEDWVTEAAAFAMVASAWVDPRLRQDVGATMDARWFAAETAGRSRPVTILESLTELVLLCPWLDEQVIEVASFVLGQLREPDPEPFPMELGRKLVKIARSHAPRRRRFGLFRR